MNFKSKKFYLIGLAVVLAGLFFFSGTFSVKAAGLPSEVWAKAGCDESQKISYFSSAFNPLISFAEKAVKGFGYNVVLATAPDPDFCGSDSGGDCAGISVNPATISWPAPVVYTAGGAGFCYYEVTVSGGKSSSQIWDYNGTSYPVSGLISKTTYGWSVEAYYAYGNCQLAAYSSASMGFADQPSGSFTTSNCAAPTADIKCEGTDGPCPIDYNTSAAISWTSTNSTYCSVSPTTWTGTSGSQSTGNLISPQTYTLTCTNPDNNMTVTDAVTVSVGTTPTCAVSPVSATKNVLETQQFTYWYDPDGAGAQNPADVTGSATWTSSNTNVATISSGLATCRAAGSVSISSTYTSASFTCSASASLNCLAIPIPPPTAEIKCNNIVGSCTIDYNTSATISWSSIGATSCNISPTGWTGTSGSQSTGNLTSSQSYAVNCNGPGGPSPTDIVVVNVRSRIILPPEADIKCNGVAGSCTIPYNTSAVISWSSINADSCSVSPGGWTGTSGSHSTGNLTSSQAYTLTCNNAGGLSATDIVVVNVIPPPNSPTADIKCNGIDGPCTIGYNTSATISWSSANTTSCSVSPGGWTGTSGSHSTGNLTSSQAYTLTCTGPGGSATDVVVVDVLPGAPLPPSADIKCNGIDGPCPIDYNTSATISWTSHNATYCNVSPPLWTGISGSHSTGNLTSSQAYTLTCNNAGGLSATDIVVVNVGVDPAGTISANPNPIQVCPPKTTGTTNITATANVSFDIRVGSPTGEVMYGGAPAGTITTSTGDWVTNGTTFYLIQANTANVLGSVTINHTTIGCPAASPTCSISASPNSCSFTSPATTCSSNISWDVENMTDGKVLVRRPNAAAGTGSTFYGGISNSGSQSAPWIDATGFTFDCLDNNNNRLSSVTVYGGAACDTYSLSGSSVNPTSVNTGGSYTMSCDYGRQGIDCVNPIPPSGTCTYTNYTGNTANFSCVAGTQTGTFTGSCELISGTAAKCCPSTDADGTLTVTSTGGAKYKCSGTSCVRDDVNGTYTDSNCDSACQATGTLYTCHYGTGLCTEAGYGYSNSFPSMSQCQSGCYTRQDWSTVSLHSKAKTTNWPCQWRPQLGYWDRCDWTDWQNADNGLAPLLIDFMIIGDSNVGDGTWNYSFWCDYNESNPQPANWTVSYPYSYELTPLRRNVVPPAGTCDAKYGNSGTYTARVLLSADYWGIHATAVATIPITVNSAPQPDFSLNSSNSIYATIVPGQAGDSTATTLTITPFIGFSSNVALSVDSVSPSLPAGSTFNFSDSTLSFSEYSVGTGSQFSVHLGAGLTSSQVYTIIVKGTGGGITRTIPVYLNAQIQNPNWREI